MVIVFIIEVVADDDDALIYSELRGGHGGGELEFVLGFPREAIFTHGGNRFSNFGVVWVGLRRALAKTWVGGGDNFHNSIITYF